MAGRNLGAKLVRRVDDWIDFPPQSPLCFGNGANHFLERDVAEDEEIEIAVPPQRAASSGTEDEGGLDAVAERSQCLAHHPGHAGGLLEEGPQLREVGSIGGDLEVDLPPVHPAMEETGARERVQLPLHGPLRRTALSHDLPQVEGLVRVREQEAEDTPARLAEQHLGGIEGL